MRRGGIKWREKERERERERDRGTLVETVFGCYKYNNLASLFHFMYKRERERGPFKGVVAMRI